MCFSFKKEIKYMGKGRTVTFLIHIQIDPGSDLRVCSFTNTQSSAPPSLVLKLTTYAAIKTQEQ